MAKKAQKIIFMYLRYSLIFYLIVFAAIVIYEIFPNLYFPKILDNDIFYSLLAILISPAFFILPGIFYDRKFDRGNFLFSFENFKYGFFLGLT